MKTLVKHTRVFDGYSAKTRDEMREDEIVVHSARCARDLLMNGITTVRDAGSLIYGPKKGIDDGVIDGPASSPPIRRVCRSADC